MNVINVALVSLFFIILNGVMISPHITHLQGIHMAVAVIAMFAMIKTAGGLLVPFFKWVGKETLRALMTFLSLVEMCSLYIPDEVVRVYMLVSTLSVMGLLSTLFWIKFDTHVAKTMVENFEGYKQKAAGLTSAAALLGLAITSLISLVSDTWLHIYIVSFLSVSTQVYWVYICYKNR